MKTAVLFSILSALIVKAAPLATRDSAPTDTQILQYALTLEHLENNFYSTALTKFSQDDFKAAGYPDWVRNRVSQIGAHEAQHVALLSGALGQDAVQPCDYSFPYTDVKSFLTLSSVIENVGVSAYLGAAASISEKAYLTVAGSILTTESRHQGWMSSAVLKGPAWSGPEDTPLDFNEVYSIASQFITSCPSSNPPLPFKAFPALTLSDDGSVSYPHESDGNYLLIVEGLASKTFPIVNNHVNLPNDIQGIAYAVVTSQSDPTQVNDGNILAGPAIMDHPFDSQVANPAPAF